MATVTSSTIDDQARVDALANYGVLDTEAEPAFDDLAHLAAELCDAPVALVSFVDRDRQWFKARVRFASPETDLSRSVCRYALDEPDLLVIPDLTTDTRTADNPLVTGDPGIRFYAGAPLRSADGHVVGSLCVIDTRPRPEGLSPAQADNLRRLGRQVVDQLEMRRSAVERTAALAREARTATAQAERSRQWRNLFERLREGLVMAEPVRDEAGEITDWRYLEVNDAWADLVSVDARSAVGRTIREVLPGVEQEWVDLAKVVDTGEEVLFERQVGQLGRWYEGRASRIGDDCFAVLFLEVTERHHEAARRDGLLRLSVRLAENLDLQTFTRAALDILGEVLAADRVGYGTVGPDGETFVVDRDWTLPGFPSLAGRYRLSDYGRYAGELRRGESVVIDDIHADPRTAGVADALEIVRARSLINLPISESGRTVAVLYVNSGEPRKWTAGEVGFVQQVAELIRQVSERRRAEERQAILNGEISHRLKNTLAMVQGVAAQTLRRAVDPDVLSVFQQRLQALGAAQDALLRNRWEDADLGEVVRRALAVVDTQDRVRASGPPVAMGARAALSTSLLLHELATNAVKHGALSVEAGRVELTWRTDAGDRLSLTWRESGGPPAVKPTRSGFGMRLLRMGLVGTGGSELSYSPDGLEASFEADLKQVEGD